MLYKIKFIALRIAMISSCISIIGFASYFITARMIMVRKKWLGVH